MQVRSQEGWLIIEADHDWLEDLEDRAFTQVTPFPEGGPNSMMTEILAIAFSRAAATAKELEARPVKGDGIGPLRTLQPGWARTFAFETTPADEVDD